MTHAFSIFLRGFCTEGQKDGFHALVLPYVLISSVASSLFRLSTETHRRHRTA